MWANFGVIIIVMEIILRTMKKHNKIKKTYLQAGNMWLVNEGNSDVR